MRDNFWMRLPRAIRRALLRVGEFCTRAEGAAQPRFYRDLLRLCRRWHVLETKFIETGENVTPDFEFCDLARTQAPADARNWHLHPARARVGSVMDVRQTLREKAKFCAFLYANPSCATRNQFAEILSRHMHVEASGRVLSCTPGAPPRRPNFLRTATNFYRPYKFVIAFENSLGLHYTSEKLALAINANTVPVYWGNPQIATHFNPGRFINAFDFDTLESLARHVMRVHADDALYLRYLSQPSRTLQQEHPRVQERESSERTRIWHGRFEKNEKRLVSGRALPLAQRRMFHRECLSRFEHKACDTIMEDRLSRAGWPLQGGVSRRVSITSRRHVWPDPAFYKAVDMDGQLDVKD